MCHSSGVIWDHHHSLLDYVFSLGWDWGWPSLIQRVIWGMWLVRSSLLLLLLLHILLLHLLCIIPSRGDYLCGTVINLLLHPLWYPIMLMSPSRFMLHLFIVKYHRISLPSRGHNVRITKHAPGLHVLRSLQLLLQHDYVSIILLLIILRCCSWKVP